LLGELLAALAPTEPVVIRLDDTIERGGASGLRPGGFIAIRCAQAGGIL